MTGAAALLGSVILVEGAAAAEAMNSALKREVGRPIHASVYSIDQSIVIDEVLIDAKSKYSPFSVRSPRPDVGELSIKLTPINEADIEVVIISPQNGEPRIVHRSTVLEQAMLSIPSLGISLLVGFMR